MPGVRALLDWSAVIGTSRRPRTKTRRGGGGGRSVCGAVTVRLSADGDRPCPTTLNPSVQPLRRAPWVRICRGPVGLSRGPPSVRVPAAVTRSLLVKGSQFSRFRGLCPGPRAGRTLFHTRPLFLFSVKGHRVSLARNHPPFHPFHPWHEVLYSCAGPGSRRSRISVRQGGAVSVYGNRVLQPECRFRCDVAVHGARPPGVL